MAYLFRNQWKINGLSVQKPMEDQWPIYLETNGRSMAYLFSNQWPICLETNGRSMREREEIRVGPLRMQCPLMVAHEVSVTVVWLRICYKQGGERERRD